MSQKIPILGVNDLQVGDKIRFNMWDSPVGNDNSYYIVTQVIPIKKEVLCSYYSQIYPLGIHHGTKLVDSAFRDYHAYKILDFVPYDPNQMISDEDDL